MIAEVRIYTMNRGKLDDFVKLWNEKLAPIHAMYELKILGAWVNRPQNEFVWIRVFDDEADRDAKTKLYMESPERRALGDAPQKLEAKIEVRTVEDVFAPAVALV
jgi:hypothetical protein